jgi:hypothetical protein
MHAPERKGAEVTDSAEDNAAERSWKEWRVAEDITDFIFFTGPLSMFCPSS